jgi:hypothetical protein
MPEYGQSAAIAFGSHAGTPGLGMQSNQSGHSTPCSQPQPQAFENIVVFAGHAKSMTAHADGLVPTYLRCCASACGSHWHTRFEQAICDAVLHEHWLHPSPARHEDPGAWDTP